MKKILSIILLLTLLVVGLSEGSYTTITGATTSGTYIAAPTSWATLLGNGSINNLAWPTGYKLLVGVNVTGQTGATATKYLSVMAGSNPPAFRAGIGNYTLTNPGAGVKWFGPLESARFVNSTGYLQMSSHNLTGTITFLKVP